MQNRARRCGHGFYESLCAVVSCEHFDGGEAPPAPTPTKPRPAARPGTSALVRAALLELPGAINADVAKRCGCSTSLVSSVRAALGLQRRKRKPSP